MTIKPRKPRGKPIGWEAKALAKARAGDMRGLARALKKVKTHSPALSKAAAKLDRKTIFKKTHRYMTDRGLVLGAKLTERERLVLLAQERDALAAIINNKPE